MAYLDHAATTPLRPEARAAWDSAADILGNPSSVHRAGRQARRLVEESRERIASCLGVSAGSIVLTSGGTESDNLGVTGAFRAANTRDPARRIIAVSAIEHKAVTEPADSLVAEGAEVETLPVDADGVVVLDELRAALADHGDRMALVAVMAVNNEVGSVQPFREIAELCHDRGVSFHTDAVQAVGPLVGDWSIPGTVAASAHKVGGPMGVGLLAVPVAGDLDPLSRGGGQELGLRAGTLNVPGVAAMAAAIEAVTSDRPARARADGRLRERLLAGLRADLTTGEVIVNSTPDSVAGIVSVSFPGCEGDALMLLLDAQGIQVSTGSACTVGIPRPSHVLEAMGAGDASSRGALRISFGWNSTTDDVAALLAALPDAVDRARRAGLVTAGESR